LFTEYDDYFGKALFLVGEIGGNDYNYAFFMGKTLLEVQSNVPKVVRVVITETEVCKMLCVNLGGIHRSMTVKRRWRVDWELGWV
jgi:hypothetical protein